MVFTHYSFATLRSSFAMAHPHSYHPVGVDIPNYVPNEWSTLALVSTFAATAVVVLATAKTLATKSNPNISIADLSKVLWASLCTSPLSTLNAEY